MAIAPALDQPDPGTHRTMNQMPDNSEGRPDPPAGSFGHVRRREYSEPGHRRKNTDLAARAQLLKIVGWSGYAAFPGMALGYRLAREGASWLWLPVLAIVFWLVTAGVAYVIVGASGRGASKLHNPSGSSTPFKRQHSGAEALKIRGEYPAAIEAYERAAVEYPEDPRPLIEIARIHRDALDDPESAVAAFKRALQHPSLESGQRFLVTRELCEVYTHRMGEPRRALPILARMAEEQAGTPPGEWAAEELTEVKALVFGEDRD